MTRAAVLALALAAPATAQTDPGTVWIGMLERCLSEMDRPAIASSMGMGWSRQERHEIAPGREQRTFRHRDTRAHAEMEIDRAARQVTSCGTGVVRHFPGPQVEAATDAWEAAEIATGRIVAARREPGFGRTPDPIPGLVRIYDWCGRTTGAVIRLELSDFPPARMDVTRRPPCEQAN